TASDDNDEIVTDLYPFYRLYKSGRVERFYDVPGYYYVEPSPYHPSNSVFSKDVSISPHVSARLYLPAENTTNAQKLPVLIYYHGGGLVKDSATFNPIHDYVNSLASELNVVVVSVEYRLAPEVDVPTIYKDCWTALQWVSSHVDHEKSTIVNKDSWLANYGDFCRVFLAGDSAGGHLVYHMTMRAGKDVLNNMKITGSILAYPYFLFPNLDIDEEGFAYRIWVSICPPLESGLSSPIDSPFINPLSEKAPSLSGLACSRILVCGGKKDEIIPLRIVDRFVEGVKENGWDGELEYLEVDDGHAFQIFKPESEEAKRMMKRYADFIYHK
ncbi:catharanthine synthase-like, partial [Lycium barbarum]|uniref:catharanthine synthase-like n=1 Tax=Lycium barbarum TaxID=112863 RepID=UPI00293F791D